MLTTKSLGVLVSPGCLGADPDPSGCLGADPDPSTDAVGGLNPENTPFRLRGVSGFQRKTQIHEERGVFRSLFPRKDVCSDPGTVVGSRNVQYLLPPGGRCGASLAWGRLNAEVRNSRSKLPPLQEGRGQRREGARGGGSGGRSAGGRHPDQASGQPGAACAPLGEQEPPPAARIWHRFGRAGFSGVFTTQRHPSKDPDKGRPESLHQHPGI